MSDDEKVVDLEAKRRAENIRKAEAKGGGGKSEKLKPIELAHQFLSQHGRRIKLFAGDLWEYDGGRYKPKDRDAIRSDLWMAYGLSANSRGDISNIEDALRGMAKVKDNGLSPPFWLRPTEDGRDEAVRGDGLVMRNGFLDTSVMELKPLTDEFFTTSRLDYDWDPEARCPLWERFLQESFEGDGERINLLEEMMGAIVMGDISWQALYVIMGKSGTGKSTAEKVMVALVGEEATTASTIQAMGSEFGLEAWVGKKLCVMSDIRTMKNAKVDMGLATQRLLGITSGDLVQVPMRYTKGNWSGVLRTSVVMFCNEMPYIPDQNMALMRRLKLLEFNHVVPEDKVDRELPDKLCKELPGILCRVLAAYGRLKAQGRFTLPESSAEALREIGEKFDFILEFIRRHCEVDAQAFVSSGDLLNRYVSWATEDDKPELTKNALSKRIINAGKGKFRKDRDQSDGTTYRGVRGIKLRTDVEEEF